MPRAQPGERFGGRVKGQPNRATVDIVEKLQRLGCDPVAGMASIADNNLPCGVCRGTGVTRYALPEAQQGDCDRCAPANRKNCLWCSGTGIKTIGERTCQSCYKTLFEAVSPELRGKMHAELTQYILPKRKALEVSGSLGSPDLAAVLRRRFNEPNGSDSK